MAHIGLSHCLNCSIQSWRIYAQTPLAGTSRRYCDFSNVLKPHRTCKPRRPYWHYVWGSFGRNRFGSISLWSACVASLLLPRAPWKRSILDKVYCKQTTLINDENPSQLTCRSELFGMKDCVHHDRRDWLCYPVFWSWRTLSLINHFYMITIQHFGVPDYLLKINNLGHNSPVFWLAVSIMPSSR